VQHNKERRQAAFLEGSLPPSALQLASQWSFELNEVFNQQVFNPV
jgi:hypothetical protein